MACAKGKSHTALRCVQRVYQALEPGRTGTALSHSLRGSLSAFIASQLLVRRAG